MSRAIVFADLNELANADPQNPYVELSDATADRLFDELGLDSFATIELLDRVEQRYGVAVPDDVVATITTPRQLLDYLVERLGAS